MDTRRKIKRPRLEFQQGGRSSTQIGNQSVADLQFIKGRSGLPVINLDMSCCDAKELTLNRVKLLLRNISGTKDTWKKSTGAHGFLNKLNQIMSGYDDYVNSEEFKQKRKQEAQEDELRRAAEMQQEEERAKKVLMESVMLNHLISKEIFQYLSVKDLLNVSLACKSFHEPARTSLRRDRKCYIEMNWVNSCDKLALLSSLMETSKIVPFNGLNIIYSCSHSCYNHGSRAEASAEALLKNVKNIKYLKLLEWPVFKDCPIFYIARKLLTDRAKSLVEISLGSINQIGNDDLSTINGLLSIPLRPNKSPNNNNNVTASSSSSSSSLINLNNLYPNVRQLTIPNQGLTDNIASLIREFILASPNLQNIVGCVVPKLTQPLVINNKVDIVKEFRFANLTSEEVSSSLVFARAGVKIQKMIVDSCASRFSTSVSTLRDTLRVLYESSAGSLNTLNISHADLLMFLGPFMPSLDNVKEMNLYYNSQYDELLRFSIIGKIDCAQKFPMLDTLIVDRSNTRFFSDREELTQWKDRPNFSSSSVTKIKFKDDSGVRWPSWDSTLMTSFARSFPNVVHAHINCPTDVPRVFQIIWTAWPNLVALTFTRISDEAVWRNMDSDFTGISEENCRKMRETGNYDNYKDLKVKSSITDLRKLKLLRLHIEHDPAKCKTVHKDVFLTEVTAKCAFAPMLLLTVLINVNKCWSIPNKRECNLNMDGIRYSVHFTPNTFNAARAWNF